MFQGQCAPIFNHFSTAVVSCRMHCCLYTLCWLDHELLVKTSQGRISKFITHSLFLKQINMEGGQSGTYLRLTRASSGPQVSVAKTYRDENKTKMNISAQTQRPSSAIEYKKTGRTTLLSVLGKCRSVPLPY